MKRNIVTRSKEEADVLNLVANNGGGATEAHKIKNLDPSLATC